MEWVVLAVLPEYTFMTGLPTLMPVNTWFWEIPAAHNPTVRQYAAAGGA